MLCFGYAVFAILLNSVGTVILQSIGYFPVDNVGASTLEAFKDLTIAVASFFIAAQLPRFGLRRSMIAALAIAGIGCLLMPIADSFWATRAMFFCVGFGFALMKVSVYSSVGLLSNSTSTHARLLGIIEASFMAAVVASAWIFAAFIDPADPSSSSWLHVYWLLAILSGIAILLVLLVRIDEANLGNDVQDKAPGKAFGEMLGLIVLRATQVFIAGIFLYVFIEQGLGTWLPTINHQVLGLDGQIAVQAASAFAMAISLGRFCAGMIVARIGWFRLLMICLAGMAVVLSVVPWLSTGQPGVGVSTWREVPFVAYLLPAIGFFMAPIYPTLNSVVLSTVPRAKQAGLIGLIVVFSALGGTTGSRMVAELFSAIPSANVLYSLLAPIALLAGATVWLHRLAKD
ncbi:MFS transporter [Tsuneonella mangrovi]|uniref:MFS transporter n=1 Tax=Tsuneonella mangrovi TaxID=1982042 RepID=UPI000BA21115|nr:MFS transporter [Tsuneonella mangrovi]